MAKNDKSKDTDDPGSPKKPRKPKRPYNGDPPKHDPKDSGGGGGYGGGGGDDEPLGEAPENIDIHEAYLRHRLEGGERPSPKTYARAVEQFKNLPGAVRGKPSFIPPDPPDDGDDVGKGGKGGKQ